MGIKSHNPTSPGRRFLKRTDFAEVTKGTPEKSLTKSLKRSGGRNNTGRMTVRHRGGGHKRRYRVVDFKRNKTGVPATIKAIEYDPNRSALLALLHYEDGEKAYILAPQKINVGDKVVSSAHADIKPGNSLKLRYMPVGTVVHTVEMRTKRGWLGSVDGKRGQVCAPSPPFFGAPQSAARVPRDGRKCFESGAR